jgi:hypothetical protein
MNGHDDCRTYVEHLQIEHSHIDHSLEELQHLLANSIERSQANPAQALLVQLIQLRERLFHHFREEEEGGCLEEAQSRSPCLSEDVRTLQSEHPGFLTDLDGLITEAELLAKRSNGLRDLQKAFGGFMRRLHAHEAEENRILLFGFGSPAMDSLSTT